MKESMKKKLDWLKVYPEKLRRSRSSSPSPGSDSTRGSHAAASASAVQLQSSVRLPTLAISKELVTI